MRPRFQAAGMAMVLVLVVVPVLSGCGSDRGGAVRMDIPFRADGILEFLGADSTVAVRIAIEIAETDSAQQRGLMDRRGLPDRGGMLFRYDTAEPRAFWMRSTPLPLDIMFIGADGRVVNVVGRTTPYSDDQIESDGPAQHVLEVRAGFTDRWDIGPGTPVRWQRVEKQVPTES